VSLYSSVGLGLTAFSRKVTPERATANNPDAEVRRFKFVYPNFHIGLFGVKFGSNRFGGFSELGVGYKGLLNFGLYGRF